MHTRGFKETVTSTFTEALLEIFPHLKQVLSYLPFGKQLIQIHHHMEFWRHPFLTHPLCPQTQGLNFFLASHTTMQQLWLLRPARSNQLTPYHACKTSTVSVTAESGSRLQVLTILQSVSLDAILYVSFSISFANLQNVFD